MYQSTTVTNLSRPDQQSRIPVRQAHESDQVATVKEHSISETTTSASGSKAPKTSLLASPNGNVTIEDGLFNATGRDHINITVINGGPHDGKVPRTNVSGRQRKERKFIPVNDEKIQTVQNKEEVKKELSELEDNINGFIWSSRTPKQCATYVRSLLPQGHGWPFYVPGPNKRLPEVYRRTGMRHGDVGIINIRGYFDFLFNICHPADHPINYQGVPKNFQQLQIEPTDIQEHFDFNGESYISSSSIKNSSGLKFESSASEGAVLAMPNGAISEDVGNEGTLKKYASIHAEDWYRYINNVRGRSAKNGDVRLVIGYLKTSRWCIATFTEATNRNPFLLELNPVIETNLGKTYEWKHSGTAVVKTGPGIQELEDLQNGALHQERTKYQNQSLFVRSISATLRECAWKRLAAESGEVEIDDSDTNDAASPESSGQSSTGSSPLNSSTMSSASTSANAPGQRTALALAHQEPVMPDHPSDIINKMLLKLSLNARVAVTSDNDWISMLRKDDLIFPSNDELCSRIKESLVIRQDKDVVFLGRPDSVTSSRCVENETEEKSSAVGLPSTTNIHSVPLNVMPTGWNEVTPILESASVFTQDNSRPSEASLAPTDRFVCSELDSTNEPAHEGSRSSLLDTPPVHTSMSLHSPETLSLGCDPNTSTSSSQSPHISQSQLDEPLYTTQLLVASSLTADIHRPKGAQHHIFGYHPGSTESAEQLGPGEMSNSRYMKPATLESSHLSIDLSRPLSPKETLISSTSNLQNPTISRSQICPVAPEYFRRYDKRRKIPDQATKVVINPFCTDFSDYYDVPGWSTCIHPEGGRYFHNAEKRIFTDADLYDPVCLNKITEAIRIIESLIYEHDVQMSQKTDLVLDLNEDEDGYEVVDYYFADHELRIVIFLHEFPSECLPHWFEVNGVSSGTHLRHALEMQYWWHCSAYPNCIELSNDLICESRAMVLHFIMDCRTSPYANSPYTSADLYQILAELSSLKDNIGKPYSGCISFLGRLMFVFSTTKFLSFFGQPEARLNRDDSVHGHWTNRRTWFIKFISIFLFSAPDVHLRNLQKIWVDGLIHKGIWEASMKKVTEEWRDIILYSTLLLNANVGFLAISSVDTSRDPYRSPAQISSYFSISVSLGSIISGLILVRQSQTKSRDASEVQTYLQNRRHSWIGLEILAIVFSLPYVLLMWGMVSFLAAFWFMCLQNSNAATRSVIVAVCVVIAILIACCIWTGWEEQEPPIASKPTRTTLFFEEYHTKLKPKRFMFERVTQPRSTKRPADGRSTFMTILEAPLKKIRRGTVEDENERSSWPNV